MIISTDLNSKKLCFDSAKPIDISLPLVPNQSNVNCFYADDPKAETIVAGDFVGSVAQGGPCDYKKLTITPHGNGTHTECFGHISARELTINQVLTQYFFLALLVSVPLDERGQNKLISAKVLEESLKRHDLKNCEALIVRSLPNTLSKKKQRHSGANPPFFEPEACYLINKMGIKHLLTDLPSVDPESDGGLLAAHKAFWGKEEKRLNKATITELVYVPDETPDGLYMLNLQLISLELDASPSKPVLYNLV